MDSEVCLSARAHRVPDSRVEELIDMAPEHIKIARDTIMYELDIYRATSTIFEAHDDYVRPKPTRTSWQPQQAA
jgi:hypothetical protein